MHSLYIYPLSDPSRGSDSYRIQASEPHGERETGTWSAGATAQSVQHAAWAIGWVFGGASHAATYIHAPYVRRRRLDWGLEPGAPGALGVQLIDDWRAQVPLRILIGRAVCGARAWDPHRFIFVCGRSRSGSCRRSLCQAVAMLMPIAARL